GAGELGVRFVSVLCALLGSGLAIACCRRLRRPEAALWLVLALNGMLLFSVGAVLMMHDSLMGFFWMLALYASLRALERPAWWLAVGLSAGAAVLCKYTGALIFACLGLALLSRPDFRQRLRSPWPWLGALMG